MFGSSFLVRSGHRLPKQREKTMAALTGYIREQDLAKELGLTVWALRAWRRRGYGPTARKIGRMVIYARNEVDDFVYEGREAGQ